MIIENNKQFLSKNLLSALENLKFSGTEFKRSASDHIIPAVKGYPLHSLYYPLKEADRIKYSDSESSLCIAAGFGAGYHLSGLSSKKKNIIAIPADVNILFDILTNIDLSAGFDKDRLRIISAEEILSYFDFYRFKSFYFVIHPVMERLFPDNIRDIIKTTAALLQKPLLEINTRRKFGIVWLNNFIKNLSMFFENKYDFSDLEIEKKIICITGAGPSLIQNINKIKKQRKNLFLAAADTSLKILDQYGIVPDALFSFDAGHYSLYHFTGIKDKFRVFTDFTTPLKMKRQTVLFSNHPLMSILVKAGWKAVSLDSGQGNIGGSMIDFFARYFPDNIILTAGIDFGIYGCYLYSNGSFIHEYKLAESGYYSTENNIDASLLYKEKATKNTGGWSTNFLMEEYSRRCLKNNNIFTLSDSPFISCRKISDISELNSKFENFKACSLKFPKPDIDKAVLADLIKKEIENDPEMLNSYFLAIQKPPDKDLLKNIFKKFNFFLKKR